MELESGEKLFSCVQCNKLFRFKSRLETHMRVHTGEKPFICPACNHHFTQFGSLKKHMKLCHTGHTGRTVDDLSIFNEQPDLKFTNDESLSSPVMNNQEELDGKPYSCDRCNKLFKYKSRWETHMRIHTGERPFGCSTCNKQFTQVGSLRRHMKYHIGDESIVCEQSDLESSKDESLMCLVNNIFSEKPAVCDQFMKNNDCKKHDETCTDEMQFNIYNRSEDEFKQIIDPRLNISRTGEMQLLQNSPLTPGNVTQDKDWNLNEKIFSCDRCNKQFRYKSRLEMHMRIHTGEKPMNCSMCNKQFTQVGSMRRHMKCHMRDEEPAVPDYTIVKDESSNRSHIDMPSEKPAMYDQPIKNTEPNDCNESDEQFKRAINSEVQMISPAMSRTPENLLVCSSLFTNDNTEQDMELKSEESLLNCEICNKQFEFKSRLETHMRVHTGEKPFNCNVCSRRFTQGGSLKKHMRCHAREQQFICDQSNSASMADGFLKIPLTPVREVLGEIELICNEFIKSTNKKLQKPLTDQMSFVCNRCNAEFKQMVDLERHAISHAGKRHSVDDPILQNDFSESNVESDPVEELFSCKECDKRFEYKSRFETHMRIHTGEKPFNCSMCNKQFTQVGSLRRHVKCHTNDSFICEQSDSKSTKDGYFMSPADNILVEKPIIYNQFNIKNTDSKELVKSYRGEMPSVCSPCNSMFEQPVDLDNHVIPQTSMNGNLLLRNDELKSDLELELTVNLFSCDQCDKIFEYKSRFETHMRIHTGERPFECSRCSLQFTQAGSLRRHMKSRKCRFWEEFVVSEQSGVDSRNDEYLNRPVKNTDDEKSDIRDQIMTNTNSCMNPCRGEMLFGCNLCNEQFSQPVDLERHTFVHTSKKQQLVCDWPLQNNFVNLESCEKLFSCNQCNKLFRYKFRLVMHMRTHTEKKPFNCSVCNKKFRQAGNFRNHMKCHAGGGVNSFYRSNWPVYKSATISNNKRWKQTVDSKRRPASRAQHKRFVCDWCNKRFTRNSILKKHRTVHTGGT